MANSINGNYNIDYSSYEKQDKTKEKDEKVEEFVTWSTSAENLDKHSQKQKVEDFEMFKFNPPTYSKDLKEFAAANIQKYDSDGDGALDFSEYADMVGDGSIDLDELNASSAQLYQYIDVYKNMISMQDKDNDGEWNQQEFFQQLNIDYSSLPENEKAGWTEYYNSFDFSDGNGTINATELLIGANSDETIPGLSKVLADSAMLGGLNATFETHNLDGNAQNISAEELASSFHVADLDFEKYYSTGDMVEALDGKLNYANYQNNSMLTEGMYGYEDMQMFKQYFFDAYYAE